MMTLQTVMQLDGANRLPVHLIPLLQQTPAQPIPSVVLNVHLHVHLHSRRAVILNTGLRWCAAVSTGAASQAGVSCATRRAVSANRSSCTTR